jgi:hypothetical protein
MGGQVLYLLGNGAISVGALYAVHRISNVAVKGLELLPGWIVPVTDGTIGINDKGKSPIITREIIGEELTAYGKVTLTIVVGVAIKFTGAFLSRDSTIDSFNSILYRSVERTRGMKVV